MKPAMLRPWAFLTAALGTFLVSCVTARHPAPRAVTKPQDLGEAMHVFVATNSASDLWVLRVRVHRFRGTATGFLGAEKHVPVTVIGSVNLTRNGTKIPVPNKAFHDLSEVRSPSQVGFISEGSPSFFIRGGTGGFAYTARFEVGDNGLKKRVVTLDEFHYREESRF